MLLYKPVLLAVNTCLYLTIAACEAVAALLLYVCVFLFKCAVTHRLMCVFTPPLISSDYNKLLPSGTWFVAAAQTLTSHSCCTDTFSVLTVCVAPVLADGQTSVSCTTHQDKNGEANATVLQYFPGFFF